VLRFGQTRLFCTNWDYEELPGYSYDYELILSVVIRVRHQHLDIRCVRYT